MLHACEGLHRYMQEATSYAWPNPQDDWHNIWQEHEASLWQYQDHKPSRPTLCLVPSLINRSYILDLNSHSLSKRLAEHCNVYLLDWGSPTHAMAAWGSQSYVSHILEPAWRTVHAIASKPFHTIGHCMGGLMTLGAATRCPEIISSLILLSTPWDFSKLITSKTTLTPHVTTSIHAWLDKTSLVPHHYIQPWFYLADPQLLTRKYAAFAMMKEHSPEAESFMRIEAWVHDGVPLTRALAKECLQEWITENRPLHSCQPSLASLDVPVLAISGSNDRIVPHSSSQAIRSIIPHTDHRLLQTGHVRMVAGETMPTLAKTIENWLDIGA